MEVEHLEDWEGRAVVDSQGEKIGKLEDVYYRAGSRDAALVSVKSGLLGRKLHLVPLEGAAVTRDELRLAYTKDAVTEGPELGSDQTLGHDEQDAVSEHYGVAAEGGLESARERRAREQRQGELAQEIDELGEAAKRKRADEQDARSEAKASGEEASELESRRARAEAEAREIEP